MFLDHTQFDTHTHKQTHNSTQTHNLTHTHNSTHTHTQFDTHNHINNSTHTHTHSHTHTHTHTHTHYSTHTHTHSHTYIQFDTHTRTHHVGLLWESEQHIAEPATCTTHNEHKRRTPMPWAAFEPAIPATEWPQTYFLDRTANRIGVRSIEICTEAWKQTSLLEPKKYTKNVKFWQHTLF